MNKHSYYLIGLGLGLICLVLVQIPGAKLRIVACDVGQGDATLLIKGSTQVLVDGGPSEAKILSCLGEQMPFWDHKIELIVMTHGDFDHSSGLIAVLERYKVMQFVTSDGVENTDILRHLAMTIEGREIGVEYVKQGDVVRVLGRDALELDVLWPPVVNMQYVAMWRGSDGTANDKQILGASAKERNLNERSIVLSILEDNKRILLMGDAGYQAEKEMVDKGLVGQVDYLKVGHHGSKYSSSQELLERVRPQTAIISVGEKNRYGHPTMEVLERLKQVGAKVRRTDEEGTIIWE